MHGGSLRIRLSKYGWLLIVRPGLYPQSALVLCPSLRDQRHSPAEVVLQNGRGLGLLTAKKGGLCRFLNEECCFYVNQSETVRDMAQQPWGQIMKRRKELANSWGDWNNVCSWHRGFSLYPVLPSCSLQHSCLALVFSMLLPSSYSLGLNP